MLNNHKSCSEKCGFFNEQNKALLLANSSEKSLVPNSAHTLFCTLKLKHSTVGEQRLLLFLKYFGWYFFPFAPANFLTLFRCSKEVEDNREPGSGGDEKIQGDGLVVHDYKSALFNIELEFCGFWLCIYFFFVLFLCIAQAHCRIVCVVFYYFDFLLFFIYFPIRFGSIQIVILATKDLEFAAHYSELACVTWQRIILI